MFLCFLWLTIWISIFSSACRTRCRTSNKPSPTMPSQKPIKQSHRAQRASPSRNQHPFCNALRRPTHIVVLQKRLNCSGSCTPLAYFLLLLTILRKKNKIELGLWKAWQVVENHLSGPAQNFVKDHGAELRDLINRCNDSILAHGFRPVDSADWQRVASWTRENFLPVLRDLARKAGLNKEPQQLPTTPPEFPKIAPSNP